MYKTVALCFGMLACAVAVGGVLDEPSVARLDQSFAVFGGEARLTCALQVAPIAAHRGEQENDPVVISADSLVARGP